MGSSTINSSWPEDGVKFGMVSSLLDLASCWQLAYSNSGICYVFTSFNKPHGLVSKKIENPELMIEHLCKIGLMFQGQI